MLSNCQLPLKFLPWGPSPGNGLYGGGWVHLIVLPSSLPPQGKQPAVGSAQLPLESGHVFFQLLSSLDPLENSASLSLEGCTGLGGGAGGQGSCLGHSGLLILPVSVESLDFGLARLWRLCVLGQGQVPSFWACDRGAPGVMCTSTGLCVRARDSPRLYTSGGFKPWRVSFLAGALSAVLC